MAAERRQRRRQQCRCCQRAWFFHQLLRRSASFRQQPGGQQPRNAAHRDEGGFLRAARHAAWVSTACWQFQERKKAARGCPSGCSSLHLWASLFL